MQILNAWVGLSFLNMLSLVSGNAKEKLFSFALDSSLHYSINRRPTLANGFITKVCEWGKQGEVIVES